MAYVRLIQEQIQDPLHMHGYCNIGAYSEVWSEAKVIPREIGSQ